MPSLPRRTIDELRARYDFESSIRDIYVEGYFDLDVVRWFLDCLELADVEVYPIETVDIPSNLPDGIGPEGGNRTRVIRLANAFENIVQEGRVVCIIDSDFDRVAETLDPERTIPPLRHLIRTDVTAMELYLFSVTSLAKLIRLIARNRNVNPVNLLTHIGPILRQLFAVRYVSVIDGFNFQWLDDLTGCCKSNRGCYVEFDLDDFIDRLLNKNNAQSHAAEFRTRVTVVATRLPEDPRFAANGHDYFDLLRWVLRAHGIFTMADIKLLERIFVACIDLGEIRTYEFWQRLETILRPPIVERAQQAAASEI